MNLYCWPYRTAHTFTAGETEEVVYALTGMLADAEKSEPSQDPMDYPTMTCPKEALHLARDSECYLEHVEQGVACRRDGA